MNPSPVQIRNPVANYQVVRLHSKQDIFLSLSGEHTAKKIKVASPFLELDSMSHYKNGMLTHKIRQRQSFGLNASSTSHLGEIIVDKTVLLVYLESQIDSKKDFITMVDPYADTVRLKPHQILEVVLMGHAGWDWTWYPEINTKIDIEELGYRCAGNHQFRNSLQSLDEPYYVGYKSFLKPNNEPTQHHFWLRFDSTIIPIIQAESSGRNVSAGTLIFNCAVNNEQSSVDVYVDLEKKYLNKVTNTLTLGKHGSVTQSYTVVKSEKEKTPKPKYNSQPENKYTSGYYDDEWPDGWQSMEVNNQWNDKKGTVYSYQGKGSYLSNAYNAKKPVECLLMDVEIKEVVCTSIEEGCDMVEWDKDEKKVIVEVQIPTQG